MAKYITTKEVLSDCEKLLYTKVIREVNILKPSGVYYPIKIYDYAVTNEEIQVPTENGTTSQIIEKKKVIKEKDINYLITDMDALSSMFSTQCPTELSETKRREWIEEQVGLYVIKNDWLKDENGESRGILIYGLQPNEWEIFNEH